MASDAESTVSFSQIDFSKITGKPAFDVVVDVGYTAVKKALVELFKTHTTNPEAWWVHELWRYRTTCYNAQDMRLVVVSISDKLTSENPTLRGHFRMESGKNEHIVYFDVRSRE